MEITTLLTLIWGSAAMDYLKIFFEVVGLLSLIAKVTPNQWDNRAMDKITGLMHMLALNPKKARGGFINIGLTLIMCLLLVTSLVCVGCAIIGMDLKPGSTIKIGDTIMRVNDNGDYCVNSKKVNQLVMNSPIMVDEGTTIITDVGTLTKTKSGLEYCMSEETANRLTKSREEWGE